MSQSQKKKQKSAGRGRRDDVLTGDAARVVFGGRVKPHLKTQVEAEAPLRGHTPSEAHEIIVELGLPLYLSKHKRKYNPVEAS